MRHDHLEHRFVEQFPEPLEPGILYVSMEYGSVAHSCCCGCGEEIVTPLTPTDWKISYNGETISLHPSVGSWTLPCRSHYVIRQNRVIVAPPWTDRQVEAERQRDQRAKARHYEIRPTAHDKLQDHVPAEANAVVPDTKAVETPNWLRRFIRWLGGADK